jgi:uncharacterized protein involved in exopolysaccharide biosynthesis
MLTTVSSQYVFRFFHTVCKRWKVYLVFCLACCASAGLYVSLTPWYYQSDAQIVVKAGDQDIAEASTNLIPQQMQSTTNEIINRIVNTHLGVLHSMDVTRETLNRLGLREVYPEIVASPPHFFGTSLDAAIQRLDKTDLTVTAPPNSNALQVSLVNRNPEMAQKALKTLIAVFTEKDADAMREPRTVFLTQQVTEARQKVDSIQNEILAYKQQNNIASLPDERSLLLHQRDLLEQNQSSENTQQTLHLSLTQAQAALATAEQTYLKVEQNYVPDNPVRQRAFAALQLARQQYKTAISALVSHDGSLADVWLKQRASINNRLEQLNQAEWRLTDLQRQLDIATQTYTAFTQRLANANFTLALNRQGSPNIAISQEPTLPYEPSQPRIRFVLALGAAMGVFGGLGLCFLLEAVDETVGLPDEVESLLGLPVLATLDYDRAVKSIARSHQEIGA